jgi:hypothetical protein
MVSGALVGRRMVLTRGEELEVLMRTPWLLDFRLFSCDVLVYSFGVEYRHVDWNVLWSGQG